MDLLSVRDRSYVAKLTEIVKTVLLQCNEDKERRVLHYTPQPAPVQSRSLTSSVSLHQDPLRIWSELSCMWWRLHALHKRFLFAYIDINGCSSLDSCKRIFNLLSRAISTVLDELNSSPQTDFGISKRQSKEEKLILLARHGDTKGGDKLLHFFRSMCQKSECIAMLGEENGALLYSFNCSTLVQENHIKWMTDMYMHFCDEVHARAVQDTLLSPPAVVPSSYVDVTEQILLALHECCKSEKGSRELLCSEPNPLVNALLYGIRLRLSAGNSFSLWESEEIDPPEGSSSEGAEERSVLDPVSTTSPVAAASLCTTTTSPTSSASFGLDWIVCGRSKRRRPLYATCSTLPPTNLVSHLGCFLSCDDALDQESPSCTVAGLSCFEKGVHTSEHCDVKGKTREVHSPLSRSTDASLHSLLLCTLQDRDKKNSDVAITAITTSFMQRLLLRCRESAYAHCISLSLLVVLEAVRVQKSFDHWTLLPTLNSFILMSSKFLKDGPFLVSPWVVNEQKGVSSAPHSSPNPFFQGSNTHLAARAEQLSLSIYRSCDHAVAMYENLNVVLNIVTAIAASICVEPLASSSFSTPIASASHKGSYRKSHPRHASSPPRCTTNRRETGAVEPVKSPLNSERQHESPAVESIHFVLDTFMTNLLRYNLPEHVNNVLSSSHPLLLLDPCGMFFYSLRQLCTLGSRRKSSARIAETQEKSEIPSSPGPTGTEFLRHSLGYPCTLLQTLKFNESVVMPITENFRKINGSSAAAEPSPFLSEITQERPTESPRGSRSSSVLPLYSWWDVTSYVRLVELIMDVLIRYVGKESSLFSINKHEEQEKMDTTGAKKSPKPEQVQGEIYYSSSAFFSLRSSRLAVQLTVLIQLCEVVLADNKAFELFDGQCALRVVLDLLIKGVKEVFSHLESSVYRLSPSIPQENSFLESETRQVSLKGTSKGGEPFKEKDRCCCHYLLHILSVLCFSSLERAYNEFGYSPSNTEVDVLTQLPLYFCAGSYAYAAIAQQMNPDMQALCGSQKCFKKSPSSPFELSACSSCEHVVWVEPFPTLSWMESLTGRLLILWRISLNRYFSQMKIKSESSDAPRSALDSMQQKALLSLGQLLDRFVKWQYMPTDVWHDDQWCVPVRIQQNHHFFEFREGLRSNVHTGESPCPVSPMKRCNFSHTAETVDCIPRSCGVIESLQNIFYLLFDANSISQASISLLVEPLLKMLPSSDAALSRLARRCIRASLKWRESYAIYTAAIGSFTTCEDPSAMIPLLHLFARYVVAEDLLPKAMELQCDDQRGRAHIVNDTQFERRAWMYQEGCVDAAVQLLCNTLQMIHAKQRTSEDSAQEQEKECPPSFLGFVIKNFDEVVRVCFRFLASCEPSQNQQPHLEDLDFVSRMNDALLHLSGVYPHWRVVECAIGAAVGKLDKCASQRVSLLHQNGSPDGGIVEELMELEAYHLLSVAENEGISSVADRDIFLDLIPVSAGYLLHNAPRSWYQYLVEKVLVYVFEATGTVSSPPLMKFVLENQLTHLLPFLALTHSMIRELPFKGSTTYLRSFWVSALKHAPFRSHLRFVEHGGITVTLSEMPSRGLSVALLLCCDSFVSEVTILEVQTLDSPSSLFRLVVVDGDSLQVVSAKGRETLTHTRGLLYFLASEWLQILVVLTVTRTITVYFNGIKTGCASIPYFQPNTSLTLHIGPVNHRVGPQTAFCLSDLTLWGEELTWPQVEALMAGIDRTAPDETEKIHWRDVRLSQLGRQESIEALKRNLLPDEAKEEQGISSGGQGSVGWAQGRPASTTHSLTAEVESQREVKNPVDDRFAYFVPHECESEVLRNVCAPLHPLSVPLVAKVVGRHATPPARWVDFHLLWVSRGGLILLLHWIEDVQTSEELAQLVRIFAQSVRHVSCGMTMDYRTYVLLSQRLQLEHVSRLCNEEVAKELVFAAATQLPPTRILLNRFMLMHVFCDVNFFQAIPIASGIFIFTQLQILFDPQQCTFAKRNALFANPLEFVDRLLHTLVLLASTAPLSLIYAGIRCVKQILFLFPNCSELVNLFTSMAAALTPTEREILLRCNRQEPLESVKAQIPIFTSACRHRQLPLRVRQHLAFILLSSLVSTPVNFTALSPSFSSCVSLPWYVAIVSAFSLPGTVLCATLLLFSAAQANDSLREEMRSQIPVLVEALRHHVWCRELIVLLLLLSMGSSDPIDVFSSRFTLLEQLEAHQHHLKPHGEHTDVSVLAATLFMELLVAHTQAVEGGVFFYHTSCGADFSSLLQECVIGQGNDSSVNYDSYAEDKISSDDELDQRPSHHHHHRRQRSMEDQCEKEIEVCTFSQPPACSKLFQYPYISYRLRRVLSVVKVCARIMIRLYLKRHQYMIRAKDNEKNNGGHSSVTDGVSSFTEWSFWKLKISSRDTMISCALLRVSTILWLSVLRRRHLPSATTESKISARPRLKQGEKNAIRNHSSGRLMVTYKERITKSERRLTWRMLRGFCAIIAQPRYFPRFIASPLQIAAWSTLFSQIGSSKMEIETKKFYEAIQEHLLPLYTVEAREILFKEEWYQRYESITSPTGESKVGISFKIEKPEGSPTVDRPQQPNNTVLFSPLPSAGSPLPLLTSPASLQVPSVTKKPAGPTFNSSTSLEIILSTTSEIVNSEARLYQEEDLCGLVVYPCDDFSDVAQPVLTEKQISSLIVPEGSTTPFAGVSSPFATLPPESSQKCSKLSSKADLSSPLFFPQLQSALMHCFSAASYHLCSVLVERSLTIDPIQRTSAVRSKNSTDSIDKSEMWYKSFPWSSLNSIPDGWVGGLPYGPCGGLLLQLQWVAHSTSTKSQWCHHLTQFLLDKVGAIVQQVSPSFSPCTSAGGRAVDDWVVSTSGKESLNAKELHHGTRMRAKTTERKGEEKLRKPELDPFSKNQMLPLGDTSIDRVQKHPEIFMNNVCGFIRLVCAMISVSALSLFQERILFAAVLESSLHWPSEERVLEVQRRVLITCVASIQKPFDELTYGIERLQSILLLVLLVSKSHVWQCKGLILSFLHSLYRLYLSPPTARRNEELLQKRKVLMTQIVRVLVQILVNNDQDQGGPWNPQVSSEKSRNLSVFSRRAKVFQKNPLLESISFIVLDEHKDNDFNAAQAIEALLKQQSSSLELLSFGKAKHRIEQFMKEEEQERKVYVASIKKFSAQFTDVSHSWMVTKTAENTSPSFRKKEDKTLTGARKKLLQDYVGQFSSYIGYSRSITDAEEAQWLTLFCASPGRLFTFSEETRYHCLDNYSGHCSVQARSLPFSIERVRPEKKASVAQGESEKENLSEWINSSNSESEEDQSSLDAFSSNTEDAGTTHRSTNEWNKGNACQYESFRRKTKPLIVDSLRLILHDNHVNHMGLLLPVLATRARPLLQSFPSFLHPSVNFLTPSAWTLLQYVLHPKDELRYIGNAFHICGLSVVPCLVLLTRLRILLLSFSRLTPQGDVILFSSLEDEGAGNRFQSRCRKRRFSTDSVSSHSCPQSSTTSYMGAGNVSQQGRDTKPFFRFATIGRPFLNFFQLDNMKDKKDLKAQARDHRHGTRVAQAVARQSMHHPFRQLYWTYSVSSLKRVACFRYMHLETAVHLEVHMGDGPFIALMDAHESMNPLARDNFLVALKSILEETGQHDDVEVHEATSRPGQQRAMLMRWAAGSLSNMDYLLFLNRAAGRTVKDYNQYPVFPWVLADYQSEVMDHTNESRFRQLSFPIGAQTKSRRAQLMEHYEHSREATTLCSDPEISSEKDSNDDSEDSEKAMKNGKVQSVVSYPYHHGTHYSTSGGLLFYLVRCEPFASYARLYHGGRFDVPGRMFHSIAETFKSCTEISTDNKELIPAFYMEENADFLRNLDHLPLGTREDGTSVNHVVLPPWAKGSTQVFTAIMRYALESDYVVKHLHEWVDLVFGIRRRGTLAVERCNVFRPMTYGEEVVKALNQTTNLQSFDAIISEVENFGQAPRQLFTERHPSHDELAPLPDGEAEEMSIKVQGAPPSVTGGAAAVLHAAGGKCTYKQLFESQAPKVMGWLIQCVDEDGKNVFDSRLLQVELFPWRWILQIGENPSSCVVRHVPHDLFFHFAERSAVIGFAQFRSSESEIFSMLPGQGKPLNTVNQASGNTGDAGSRNYYTDPQGPHSSLVVGKDTQGTLSRISWFASVPGCVAVEGTDYYICWNYTESCLMRFNAKNGSFLSMIPFFVPNESGVRITVLCAGYHECALLIGTSSGDVYAIFPDAFSVKGGGGSHLHSLYEKAHDTAIIGMDMDSLRGRAISFTGVSGDQPILWRVGHCHLSILTRLSVREALESYTSSLNTSEGLGTGEGSASRQLKRETLSDAVQHAFLDKRNHRIVVVTKQCILLFDGAGRQYGFGILPSLSCSGSCDGRTEVNSGMPITSQAIFSPLKTAAMYETTEWAKGMELLLVGHEDGTLSLWRITRLPPSTVKEGYIVQVQFHVRLPEPLGANSASVAETELQGRRMSRANSFHSHSTSEMDEIEELRATDEFSSTQRAEKALVQAALKREKEEAAEISKRGAVTAISQVETGTPHFLVGYESGLVRSCYWNRPQ